MMTALLILGVLTMAQAESPLSLEAASGVEDGKPVVVARMRNKGKQPCVVVVDDYFCQVETQLYDEKGKLLEPHDGRAVQGFRLPPNRVKAATLQPGEAVEVMTFSIVTDYANAMAGPLSWEVHDLAGQTLKVGFTYSFPKEKLEQVEKLGAAGAVVGDWKSPKVEVPTTTLTQKQVNNVLSSRRMIQEAGAVPLLVKALAHKDEVVREYACASLGDLKATIAATDLARLLRKDKARVVRINAARALGQIADPETREALTAAAGDEAEDSLVRSSSEDALKKLKR